MHSFLADQTRVIFFMYAITNRVVIKLWRIVYSNLKARLLWFVQLKDTESLSCNPSAILKHLFTLNISLFKQQSMFIMTHETEREAERLQSKFYLKNSQRRF